MRAATKQRVECVRAALLALPDERLLSIVRPWVDDVLREIQESDAFAHMLGYKIQASLTGRIYDVDDDDDATDDELALVAPDAGELRLAIAEIPTGEFYHNLLPYLDEAIHYTEPQGDWGSAPHYRGDDDGYAFMENLAHYLEAGEVPDQPGLAGDETGDASSDQNDALPWLYDPNPLLGPNQQQLTLRIAPTGGMTPQLRSDLLAFLQEHGCYVEAEDPRVIEAAYSSSAVSQQGKATVKRLMSTLKRWESKGYIAWTASHVISPQAGPRGKDKRGRRKYRPPQRKNRD